MVNDAQLTKQRQALSLWDYATPEQEIINSLAGDVSVDVAIVGGGFTGMSTALHLGERGVSCAVLEANRIGYGGSGRNVGLVNAGLWLPPQDIRDRLGETQGNRLVQILADAPAYVMSLIDRHQVQCEPTRTGTIHAAHAPSGLRDLERRAEHWQQLGAPVELLDATRTTELTGTTRFCGGLLDHRAGTINPMGYVRGLARAAVELGAQVYTDTRVRQLKRSAQRWQLDTATGTVSADAVVLGTNAYTDPLWPELNQTFTPIHYFQLATTPLGDAGADILPGRQGVWNTAPIMFSMRRDQQGRLILGSMGRIHASARGNEHGLSSRWATRQVKRYFPTLPEVQIEKAWFGTIAMTPDHLPRIYRLADGVYSPIGYNGRGITPGTMFGSAMAELLTGGDEANLPLPVSTMQPVRSAPLKSRLYGAAFAANQWMHSL